MIPAVFRLLFGATTQDIQPLAAGFFTLAGKVPHLPGRPPRHSAGTQPCHAFSSLILHPVTPLLSHAPILRGPVRALGELAYVGFDDVRHIRAILTGHIGNACTLLARDLTQCGI
jgi:hypothetical protein